MVHLDNVKGFNPLYCVDMNAQSLSLEIEGEGHQESVFVWITNLSKCLRSIARVNGADSALKVAKVGFVGTGKSLVLINLPYAKVDSIKVSFDGALCPFLITGCGRQVVLHDGIMAPINIGSGALVFSQVGTMFHPPLIRDRMLRRLGINLQRGPTFVATDGLFIFALGAVRALIRMSIATKRLQIVKMFYTSCLGLRGAQIAWGVDLSRLTIVVTSRIMGTISPRTTSRRELGDIQISPHTVGAVVLADGASPTWAPISFDAMKDSRISVRSWGSAVAEVAGSCWKRMGASVSKTGVAWVLLAIMKTRPDALNIGVMRILLNIPLIYKCSRAERL